MVAGLGFMYANGVFTVTNADGLNAAIANIDAIGKVGNNNGLATGAYTIRFGQNITLSGTAGGTYAAVNADGTTGAALTINSGANPYTVAGSSQLYALNLSAGVTVTIDGSNGAGGTYMLDGANTYNGFFNYAGNVTISNLAINNAKALGGQSGGGGGAGLGGGLFVGSAGQATLNGVTFSNNSAVGGNGGIFGGGGGLEGGNGSSLGGGGVGLSASSNNTGSGSAGIILGAAPGGSVGPYTGGANGGGGGSGTNVYNDIAAGGGVGASSVAGNAGEAGGNGGFGGGGGYGAASATNGVTSGNGGLGGFGGGGGTGGLDIGAGPGNGGNGGFGGGGGGGGYSSNNASGVAGLGGFGAADGRGAYGGGGLGAGGAIFVQQGGSLTFTGGSVAGGRVAGGGGLSGSGAGLGSGVFLQGNQLVNLSANLGQVLTIGDVIADQTGSLSPVFSDRSPGTGSLLISGPGTVVLGAANTYTGATTVSAGILNIQNSTALGTAAGGTTVAAGATLQLQGDIAVGPELLSLAGTGVGGNGVLENVSGNNTYGGAITLTADARIQSDAGLLTLSGANAGNTVTGNFNLTVGGAGNTTITGRINTGTGSLTKDGAGTLTLSQGNPYTGATTISSGTLVLSGDGGISLSSSVAVAGTFDISVVTSAQVLVNNAFAGSAITDLSGGGSVKLGAKTLVLLNATSTFAGSISDGGIAGGSGGGLYVFRGTETLTGANTYTGATTIAAGATLQFGAGGTSGTISAGSAITDNGALAFNHNDSLIVANTITGTGGLTHAGTGTLTLTGADIYTGATTISGGTLLVNGSIANSATTVQTGGTLGGSGTTGAVNVASGGFLSPGNSPGLLHTGNLALANGATYVEQIGGTTVGTQYDQTDVTGTVNLNSGNAASGATLNVTAVNGFTPVAGQTYVIINNDGNDAVQGTFAGLAEGATVTVNGVNLVISYRGGDGNDVTLTDPVPYSPPSGPTAVSDTVSATFGTALTKAAPGVLANDSGAGGALTVTAVNGQTAAVGKAVAGAYGSLTLNGDGSYAYTPDATKTVFTTSVVDHFTYTDTANGQTATASLDITVSAPPASTLALFGTVVTNSATQTGSVYALYEGLLGRAPDALGLEGFSASLQAGAKLTDVASAILGSAEHGPAITDPTSYVQSLYTNTLHRGADGGGLIYYTNELNAGVSQAQVAVQIATSTEAQQVNATAFSTGVFVTDAIDAGVARLYYGVLGRTPDAGGLQAFEMQVKQAAAAGGVNGAVQSLANVANAMLGSSEYGQTHAGQSSTAFVDNLFVGALGRHADAGGAAFYANELSHGVSQAQVALQIAESPEAQVHLVGQIELGWHLA